MEKTWHERFADRFSHLKQSDGMTQQSLADACGVGQATIAHWLNGRRKPKDLRTFERLANALGLHPAYLIYGITSAVGLKLPSLDQGQEYIAANQTEKLLIERFRNMREPDRTNWLMSSPKPRSQIDAKSSGSTRGVRPTPRVLTKRP